MRTPLMQAALVAAALCAVPAAADPPPFPEFSAKRVGVPKPGEKRITIQIEPPPPAPPAEAVAEAPDAGGPRDPSPGRYAWFWDKLSPELVAGGPGRLEPALTLLANPPGGQGVTAPRVQALQEIARAHGAEILRATVGTGVSPALALAVIAVESSGRADAVSPAGAQGLMQLMPATAARFGVDDSFAASENIRGGVAYLDWLLRHFGSDPVLALAGYNAGEGAVRDHAGVPPYPETRDYVPKVLAAFSVARGLCREPPELVSDGCIFAVR